MKKYIYILIAMFSSFIFSSVGAFNYGSNAREVALGGSSICLQSKGFNSFSNPSFLSKIKKPEWGVSFFTMSLDRSIQAVSYSRPVDPSGGISLSFLKVGIDDIRLSDKDNNQLVMYNHWEGYGMMSFALNNDLFSFGMNLKLFLNQLMKADLTEYPARGLGLDLGINYMFDDRLNMSFVTENLMANYKWGKTSNKIKEDIPVLSKLGILFKYSNNLNIMTQYDYSNEHPGNFRQGFEYKVSTSSYPFTLRLGIKENNDDKVSFMYYLGFGIIMKLENDKKIHLDYALDPGNVNEGISHIFSFSM